MKKLLIMTCAMCIFIAPSFANPVHEGVQGNVDKCGNKPQFERKMPTPEQMKQMRKVHEQAFEQKLGLTEVQKLKARELRKSGHEKMKPVMEEIKAKKQEAEMIRNSKLSVQAQEEKLTAIDNDLAVLKKQARDIRKQNMKDFEAILTKDQKKTLKNMKKEGRKHFDEHRKEIPPQPRKPFELK